MTNFLEKIFIKDSDDPTNEVARKNYGVFASVVGIILNVILATFKILVGALSGSIAIIADSLNNYSDAGASIVSFVSFKIAAKPADRDHPFGHARIEYVCSMIVSFIILLVGFELFASSISLIISQEEKSFDISAFSSIVLIVSVILKLWLAIFYKKVGKKINSSVLEASSTDSIFDAISTSAVFAANIIVSLTNLWYIDAIVGIAVSTMIFVAGIRILIETKNSILGEAPTTDLIEKINCIVSRYSEVIGVHDMLVHNYGPNRFIASFHAEVDGNGDIFKLHDTIDLIERQINSEIGVLCTIHMDPIVTDDENVSVTRENISNLVCRLYAGASIHDFRMVVGHTHTNLIFDIALPFEIKDTDDAVKTKVYNAIKEENPTFFAVLTIDRQ